MNSDQAIMKESPVLSGGAVPSVLEQSFMDAALKINNLTEDNEQQQGIYQSEEILCQDPRERHKSSMKIKYGSLFEGIQSQENNVPLDRMYTQLSILEGESERIEVLQIEKKSMRRLSDTVDTCLDMFKPQQSADVGIEENKKQRKGTLKSIKTGFQFKRKKGKKENKKLKMPEPRTVLTKGIAGIGKTLSVQKFILDWAEGKDNQDLDFIFVLPFRKLNLIKDDQYSLHGLLCAFHPELRDLDPKVYDQFKVVFIFDGLDESSISLNFEECEKISDITMTSSVGVLITNLIRGDLFPSGLIWITSRPAAANQIPPQYIHRVTEILGFNDSQKEEYFRKRIRDQDQAQKIISHIKTARSLCIMCQIPVFCWISATVLQRIITQSHTEIPKTLTEMYSHFLHTQTNMTNEKYEEKDERDPEKLLESNRTELLKLAELSYTQLLKGNVMFLEEDLRESSIDVTEASVYSGIFTEIFREEVVLHQTVYCFVHLSFQEFLAAIYVFHCFENKNMEALKDILCDDHQDYESKDSESSEDSETEKHKCKSKNVPLDELLKHAVDKAVKCQDGHLDLFLIFLLGISLESNQTLLQGLLTQTQCSSDKTKDYIMLLIKGDTEKQLISTDRCINLCLCLFEMNDQSLSRELQEYLLSEKRSEVKLSPGHCSAIACMLLISEEALDELDLDKFNTSEEGYRRIIPAVTICRKAKLAGCELTKESWEIICSVLQSANSFLKELDLSNNDLLDGGVELLSAGLKNSNCKLETLRLALCKLGEKACKNLGLALQSANSSLKELDLSNNDLQDSGIKLFCSGLKNSQCKLKTLRLAFCSLEEKSCKYLGSILQLVNISLNKLDLNNNELKDAGVELLSAGLKSSNCKLEMLRLSHCSLGDKACEYMTSVLQSEHSLLKEIDLSNNDLQDSGVELLCLGLKSLHCKLETLRLSGCMVTDEGCFSLASALKSRFCPLRELDLTYNHPGDSGGKLVLEILEDKHYALQKLQMEHGGEARINPGLKKYACDIILDSNTAHRRLSLSEENRKVERGEEKHYYLDHPDRFKHWEQVLNKEGLTGRCYWEVEWSGVGAYIAVSYKGINREGDSCHSGFGLNKNSWSLHCSDNMYTIRQSENVIRIPSQRFRSRSNRVGVYLDWEAGTLSFYIIPRNTHTLAHLHTLYSTFTEPVYTGFRVDYDSSVRICKID
ncbi:NACHT, LRR and PYD domains-containing protein 3-like [Hoplias malabaricus]|uniref:NACHT, LRR and PYD domains-containing protein 3-like n=1 Tax=Hoplias malabaricus TaxID=27720 RepID=UPI0034633766